MSVSRVYRLLRMVTMLQGNRSYTVAELAAEMEISRRTVFRDLNLLEMAHIPYYFDPASGGYRINQHFFLPPINLTLSEALAILTMTGNLRGVKKLPLLSHGAKAAMKVESALPPPLRQHVGSVAENLSVHLGPLSRHEGLDAVFDDLTQAIVHRKVCLLVYISFAERKQIVATVHPLRMMFAGRAWYIIAHSVKHREHRTFKLGRIRKLTVTDRTFEPPKNLDLGRPFGNAWGMIPEGKTYRVQLHFLPKVAGNVAEVQWHRTQRVQWNTDGSLNFYVAVDGLGEITWWILGYGDQVEVKAPAELRNRVCEVAQSVAAKHAQEATQ